MNITRRGFMKALGAGAGAAAVAVIVPMGLLTSVNTKYERAAQELLKARVWMKQGNDEMLHETSNNMIGIVAHDFDMTKVEDVLFAVSLLRQSLKNDNIPIYYKRLTNMTALYENYERHVFNDDDYNPIREAVGKLFEHDQDEKLHRSILQGYLPELSGPRNIG